MYKKVTIVGLGLIGGSIAKALRRMRCAESVCAYARNIKSKKRYERLNIVDSVSMNLKESAKGADVILLCVSPTLVKRYMELLAPIIEKKTLLMDVASTKEEIVRKAKKVFTGSLNFVGAHPMAGSEKKGAEHARENLYDGSICFLTPVKRNTYFKEAQRFWKNLGCRPVCVPAQKHDKIVSYVSHLPHVLAYSLMSMVSKKTRKFAAGGFKSIERLALSDPKLWKDIFLTNRTHLRSALKRYIKVLSSVERSLKAKDIKTIETVIRKW